MAAQAPSATYQDVYNGWKWWHVYCYRCHGTNAIATTLAPSLIDPSVKRTSKEFLKVVREGVPDKGMQAWDKLLDDKQINQIYLYVKARTDTVLPPGRPDDIYLERTLILGTRTGFSYDADFSLLWFVVCWAGSFGLSPRQAESANKNGHAREKYFVASQWPFALWGDVMMDARSSAYFGLRNCIRSEHVCRRLAGATK